MSYIQYVGFNVGGGSRSYNFDVVGTAEEAREFTVKLQSEAFRPSALKFQDGPDICFRRVKRELEAETHDRHAQNHLEVGREEIQDYVERNSPHKRLKGELGTT